MKRIGLITMFFLLFTSFIYLHAQWTRTYGGSGVDEARSIQQTSDGGYIVVGNTQSFGAGLTDCWVLKLSSTGDIEWQRTYGGTDSDLASSIQQTSDGGYIILGWTYSFGAGGRDIWVLKLSSAGDIEWQRIYGGTDRENPFSIKQTSDGGYVIVGDTASLGAGLTDCWILKLSSTGDIEWQHTYGFGTPNLDSAQSIQQTSDGGYIIGGYTGPTQYEDFLVLKVDSNGSIEWQKKYAGSETDWGYSIQQTSEGGYIIAGKTYSLGAGTTDIWVLKLSSTGDIEWQRIYGGNSHDGAYSIQQTSEGGYIIAGSTSSFGAGSGDIWVLKLSSAGDIEWQRTYGGTERDYRAYSIQQTSDGGYVVAGTTNSFGAGSDDILVLKLYSDGDIDASCGFIGSSNATITDTFISPLDTSITPQDTDVIPLDTICLTQDTYVAGNLLCEAPKYSLTILTTDRGTTDPNPGSHTYYDRTEVQIEAIPDVGYDFLYWSGDIPSGHENDNPITITMGSDKSIKAHFQYTLTLTAGIGGTTNPVPGTYTHDSGAQVSVQAIPSSGYQFSGWSGDASRTSNPITVTMDEDKSITANFSQIPSDGDSGGGGMCFIATAAYGSPLHPYVDILRDFRDKYLMPNKLGRKLVNLYYEYSPFVANIIAKHKILGVTIRYYLLPVIAFSYSMVHLGSLITGGILLLILMLPIFLMSALRRKRV